MQVAVLFLTEFHGFTAVRSTGDPFSCNIGDKISFPDVITNVGGSYVPGTSDFICPVRGVYMFFTTIMSQLGENGRIIITVEGAATAAIYPDGSGGSWDQSAGLAIMECDAGGRVWIECGLENTRIHVNPNVNYNTFSGMLVHAF